MAKANVEFFGWQQVYRNNPPRYEVLHQAVSPSSPTPTARSSPIRSSSRQNYQWLITAPTAEGRFAYLGFTGVWYRPPRTTPSTTP